METLQGGDRRRRGAMNAWAILRECGHSERAIMWLIGVEPKCTKCGTGLTYLERENPIDYGAGPVFECEGCTLGPGAN